MPNRIFAATSILARRKAAQSATWMRFARDAVSGFITTAHHMLMILGIIAICGLGVIFFRPDVADHLKALSPFTEESHADSTKNADAAPLLHATVTNGGVTPSVQVTPASVSATPATGPTVTAAQPRPSVTQAPPATLDPMPAKQDKPAIGSTQQKWVTDWISKRYRIAADATNVLVSAAYVTAKEIKLDPLLILSVIAIESGFNPFAESPVGAQGLMQVMSKIHRDKFESHGGLKAALNPMANIQVGSLILKDYVTRTGSIEAGLKMYVGAGAFDSDSGYGSRVMAEYRRLKEVAMGKKVPVTGAPPPAAPAKPATTTQTIEAGPYIDSASSKEPGLKTSDNKRESVTTS